MGRERDLLAKIAALRDGAKTEGERRAAEAAARRIADRYGVPEEIAMQGEEPAWHEIKYRTKRERRLLLQVAASVMTLADLEGYFEPAARCLCLLATDAEAAEVEYRYEYYRRLYVDEEEVLYEAFLQKHNIFPSDGETSDVDDERAMRMLMMSRCLSDSKLRRALPDADGGDA